MLYTIGTYDYNNYNLERSKHVRVKLNLVSHLIELDFLMTISVTDQNEHY
jgi:hypothetical protein